MHDRIRIKLFEDEEQVEEYDEMDYTPSADVISVLLTPPEKGGNFTPWKNHNNTSASPGIKRKLFPVKRPAEHLCVNGSSLNKRFREADDRPQSLSLSVEEERVHSLIRVVDRLVMREELIADGSREYSLPTIPGKELKSISPKTMADLLDGKHDSKVKKYTVIDCRYPYEFNGGHIKGAINLSTHESIQRFIQQHVTSQDQHVLIFHCEFSSQRGPKMYRYLRSLDRDLNKDHYPRLHFPEIYLLEGGYKAFFQQHKNLCDPDSYTPMLHSDHVSDLRHFRAKSKSWVGGEEQNILKITRDRNRIRLFEDEDQGDTDMEYTPSV